ncbi:decaprenylphospho-beta-D-ribofuranose 2-oxidase [Naumannella cuiyingiana]|uniref:Decaprenylphospho-beta-D-ribofuranose 2-oxidase n=1 Tax=Naumannella cuiyingiana TaxID=1347891 RepID=A0A7Z0D7B6_9ACTN|nr:decaprenylphospho-beta-D-ribofuranose 2-oxidase [Naumannella cuiyingiana]
MSVQELHGFGRAMRTRGLVRPVRTVDDAVEAVREASARAGEPGARGLIARGLGSSYGDPAQNSGGLTLDLTQLNQILSLDAEAEPPLAVVEAGVSLDQLMRAALPLGLWVPVLPGTRQVTIGGAIAADVHGKNHHKQGSFGNHVRSLDLLTADGEIRTLTPDGEGSAEFWATVGGMGLTGIVLRATIAMQRCETGYFTVDTDRTADLDETIDLMTRDDDNYTYTVSWMDAVTSGRSMGRAVYTRGEKATRCELPDKLRGEPLRFVGPKLGTVPDVFPNGMLNKITGAAFSEFWYRKAPKHRVGEVQNITQFFQPLDVFDHWNRGYGPAGFLQYQFQIPFDAEAAFRRTVEMITSSGHISGLNVLKRFGEGNRGLLSFPRPGWTFTVDLPIRRGLDRLVHALDQVVLGAGGRLYLAKDSRVDAATFAQMYPRLDEFRELRARLDPHGIFVSDQARRLGI